MTLLFYTTDDNISQTKFQLKISGHYSNQRIMDQICVTEHDDVKVKKSMSLDPADYEYEDHKENKDVDYVIRRNCKEKTYNVPTIKCDAIIVAPYIRHESRTTFFLIPHPYSNNKGLFVYYKYYDENNIYLYRHNSYVYYVEPEM